MCFAFATAVTDFPLNEQRLLVVIDGIFRAVQELACTPHVPGVASLHRGGRPPPAEIANAVGICRWLLPSVRTQRCPA